MATVNQCRCMHCIVMCKEFSRSGGREEEFWSQAQNSLEAWERCWKPEKRDGRRIGARVVAIRVRSKNIIVGRRNFWL
jgi:hypothetical protein